MREKRSRAFWAVALCASLTVVSAARAQTTVVRFVDVGAAAGGNGQTWATAYNDLSTALSNSNPSETEIYQLWVAAGTYKPNASSRLNSIQMKSRVEIYGGFAGNESNLNDRDWVENVTILSGDIVNQGDPTDNSYHVVTANGVATTARLNGFTVRDGRGDSSTNPDDRTGAGIFIRGTNSSPRIENCTITANEVLWASGTSGSGGGVGSISGQNSPTFTNCVISNNRAEDRGGGMYLLAPSLATITECTFTGNSTTVSGDTGGGAVYTTIGTNQSARRIVLTDCLFSGNFTTEAAGGAIWHQGINSTMEIDGGVFDGNTANIGAGGGIYVTSSGNLTVKNTLFTGNHSTQQSSANGGGAIGMEATAGVQHIVNCRFFGNVVEPTAANQAKPFGGAIWSNTVSGVGVDALFVTNCLFAGNMAGNANGGDGDAGAIFCSRVDQGPGADDFAIFTNVTVADNTATVDVGGIAVETTNAAKFFNCILWNNVDENGTGSDSNSQIGTTGRADVDCGLVTYSCVMGEEYTDSCFSDPDTIITENIYDDPLFGDPAIKNYRLTACSPASDTGNNASLAVSQDPADLDLNANLTEDTPRDGDLRTRRLDNPFVTHIGGGSSPFVDMGAFEFDASVCALLGDMNNDSSVDGRDLQPFTNAVMANSVTTPCGDVNFDSVVDTNDIPLFVDLLFDITYGEPACGVYQRGFVDCNNNGVRDINDIAAGTSEDCNANGIPDECDIDAGDPDGNEEVSNDANANGIPDECEDDCNSNGVPDAKDISDATSDDCDTNGIPDECEPDCNTNSIVDACDVDIADPDGNSQVSADCDGNKEPDECQQDCNSNGVPDDCDIDPEDPDGDEWVSPDCNTNGFPDECDLAIPPGLGGSLDCNTNGIPDECDIASCESDPACGDCNENGIPDSCDIAAEISEDANTNGIPDECEGEGMMGGGGGESMMSGGGEESTAGGGYATEAEAWEAYYEWAAQQCWGPACETSGAEQFTAMAAKLLELGLPVTGRPIGS